MHRSSSAPSHNLNQCWRIVNYTLRNKFQWNLDRNSNIFIQEMCLKMSSAKMAVILSRERCVNGRNDIYIWLSEHKKHAAWCEPSHVDGVCATDHVKLKARKVKRASDVHQNNQLYRRLIYRLSERRQLYGVAALCIFSRVNAKKYFRNLRGLRNKL